MGGEPGLLEASGRLRSPAHRRRSSSARRNRPRLAGKSGDVRGALDAVREALSELSRLAATELETAGHNASPGAMRAVTATLEALSAYGTADHAPRAGRLVDEVDPPGFETLAALVPNAAGSSASTTPSRVLQFQQQAAVTEAQSQRGHRRTPRRRTARETRRGESRRAGRRQEPCARRAARRRRHSPRSRKPPPTRRTPSRR